MKVNPNFEDLNDAETVRDHFEDFKSENVERTIYTASEMYLMDNKTIPCLIEPIIPKIGIFTLVGSSDTGKSMLLRQLALSIANGTDFLGFKVNSNTGKVIFVATEDDHVSTSYLLRKQSNSIEGLENILFNFETENIPEFLENELSKNQTDLVIIDAWSDVFGQNLNDSALIRQTLNIYKSISHKYNCAIGFLHHVGKRTQKLAPSKDNILSGQGFEAKMRLVLDLRVDNENPDYRHLSIVKGNYLGSEFKTSSYKLLFDKDTFLFSNTGERVMFEELAEKTEDQKRKSNTNPMDVTDEIHNRLLMDVYKSNKPLLASELYDRLSMIYGKHFSETFGRDKTKKFARYLEDENFIEQVGTKGTKTSMFDLTRRDG
jgi:hypothetical protein